ncbi:MAG: sigma-70 family RNA polymerase sigma factor [Deltaproteobacteria bacterium]|nr:sigma-70 family RNA polymerase sigma factor [Deltaproteobacteria bacterium]
MKNIFQKSKIYLSDLDVQLMLEVKEGNKKAFETLMQKYYPRILNFIYRFVGNKATAEDLTQEVFLRVYKSARRYKPRSKFQTWLFTIAKNIGLNELRRSKKLTLSLDEMFDSGEKEVKKEIEDPHVTSPDEEIIQMEKTTEIRAAINDLPENQRIAVILKRYEGFSYAEIAATLKVSDKAVKSLLSRAKENLKNRLANLIHQG